jgi:hypothetical protein
VRRRFVCAPKRLCYTTKIIDTACILYEPYVRPGRLKSLTIKNIYVRELSYPALQVQQFVYCTVYTRARYILYAASRQKIETEFRTVP